MATNLTGGHARCLQALILLAARCLLERMSTGPQPLMSHELLNYAPPPVPERIHNAHIRACSRVYLSFPPFLPSLRSRVRTRTRESRIKVHAQESAYFLAPPFRAALSDRESCEGCELSILLTAAGHLWWLFDFPCPSFASTSVVSVRRFWRETFAEDCRIFEGDRKVTEDLWVLGGSICLFV